MAKVNIDLEKLICSYREELERIKHTFHVKAIDKALDDQGIEYKDGSLCYIGEEEMKKAVKEVCEEIVKPKFKVGDWINHPERGVFKVLWVGNSSPCYELMDTDGKTSIELIREIDSYFHLWTEKPNTIKFEEETPQTLEEISKKGYVDMGRPVELAVQKEPDLDGMVEGYKQMIGYNTLIKWAPHLRSVVDSKVEAYKDGLKDMWRKLKEG